MNINVFFKEVGGDYETVMSRLPSEALVKKFLNKFPQDPLFDSLKNAYEQNDVDAAFLAAHTLKGTAANLGLDTLADAASELTEQLRRADALADEKYFLSVANAYELTISKIALID